MTQGKGKGAKPAALSVSSAAAQPASRTKTAMEILMQQRRGWALKDALDDVLGVPQSLRAPYPEDRTEAEGEATQTDPA